MRPDSPLACNLCYTSDMGWKPDSSLVVDDAALTLLRGALAAFAGADAAFVDAKNIDWTAFESAALAGKLVLMADRGLRLRGIEPAPSFQAAVQRQRQRIMALNAVNLSTLGRLVPKLQQAGLPFAVFKGAM